MEYLMVSTAVVDEIHLPFLRDPVVAGGGAGLYAYAGARLWNESVGICCGKGIDFKDSLQPVFEKYKLDQGCMFEVDANTPRTIVRYQEDGERIEKPVYGSDHYQKFVASMKELKEHLGQVKGVYLFKEADDAEFWDALIKEKQKHGFSLLWEISASSANPCCKETVLNLTRNVDVLSINRTEARNLFSGSEEEVIDQLKELDIPLVFYRRGKEGAFLIQKGQVVSVPSDFSFELVDPTGAGNSSSAATLVGYCEKKSLYEIGIMGSLASGSNITQFGPAPLDDPALYTRVGERLRYWMAKKEKHQ